jgi:hypothetical protein
VYEYYLRGVVKKPLFAYRLLMLSECRMDDTAVEQNFGCVGDSVEDLQCLVELVVVVAGEGCHPGFDFLSHISD